MKQEICQPARNEAHRRTASVLPTGCKSEKADGPAMLSVTEEQAELLLAV